MHLGQGHRPSKARRKLFSRELVAQAAERPAVCERVQGANLFDSASFNLTARPIPKVYGLAFSAPAFRFNRSESSVRSVGATRSVWAREIAGANPAALTNFNLLPWSNTSGIRLLSGTMQVEVLPAAPLPGSVKVARRPVKPLVLVRVQVWQPFSGCNVSSRRPCSERGGRRCNSCHPDHLRKAGRYKLAAPVPKTGSA